MAEDAKSQEGYVPLETSQEARKYQESERETGRIAQIMSAAQRAIERARKRRQTMQRAIERAAERARAREKSDE